MRKLIALSVITVMMVATSTARAHTGSITYQAKAWYIISHVFPASTRSKAFAVASCETVRFSDFWNDTSHATDLFQEMPGNDKRVFRWNHKELKLNWKRLSHKHPTWYAAKVALFQSQGGTNWSEWDCG